MAIHVYFEDVDIGDELPAFTRTTDLMNWNRYASVNDEFTYTHMDDEIGRAKLNPEGAFGMGNLRLAYIVNMLTEWAGDEAEIRETGIQFRAINKKGDVLRTTGRVVAKERDGDDFLVRIETDVVNQDGESTSPGYAVVALPSRDSG